MTPKLRGNEQSFFPREQTGEPGDQRWDRFRGQELLSDVRMSNYTEDNWGGYYYYEATDKDVIGSERETDQAEHAQVGKRRDSMLDW
jgi:hypothetical protein